MCAIGCEVPSPQYFSLSPRRPVSRFPRPVLAQSVKTLSQRAPPAREHRRIAQRKGTSLGLAQLLDEIEKIRRVVRLKRHHKLLIVEAKRIRRVKFHRAILHSDADVL